TSKQRTTLKRTGETSSGPWVFEVDEVLLAHLLSLLVPFRRLGQSILLCPGLGGVCAQRRALVLRCLLLEEGGVLLQQRLRLGCLALIAERHRPLAGLGGDQRGGVGEHDLVLAL